MTTLTTTPMNQSVFQKVFDTLRCPLLPNILSLLEKQPCACGHPTRNTFAHSLKRYAAGCKHTLKADQPA
jgi:hypothetical protein